MGRTIEQQAYAFLEGDTPSLTKSTDMFFVLADKVNTQGEFIQERNLDFTRDKIIAARCKKLVLLVNEVVEPNGGLSFLVDTLPFAASLVATDLKNMGFHVSAKQDKSRLNNRILNIYAPAIYNLNALESVLETIPGVITSSIFAQRKADIVVYKKTAWFKECC